MTAIDSYVKLLLHCDGADASTTITDASPAAHGDATLYAHTQIDTAYSKFGGSAVLLDGTDDYFTFPDHADWNFGTGDLTIDFWLRPNATGSQNIFGQYADANNYWNIYYSSTAIGFQYKVSSSWVTNFGCAPTLTAGNWYHIAVVRSSGVFYTFVNGVSNELTLNFGEYDADLTDLAAVLKFGQENNNVWLNGHLDEFRVSKGIARWTANFTPPTKPYGSGGGAFLFNMI